MLSWSNCIQTYHETFGVIKKNLIYLIVVTIIITTGATIISVNVAVVAVTTSRCIRPVCCYLSCQPKGPIPRNFDETSTCKPVMTVTLNFSF